MRRISILTPIIAVVAIAALSDRLHRTAGAHTGSPAGGSDRDSNPCACAG